MSRVRVRPRQKPIGAERESYLRSVSGHLHGRPERGLASRYLLNGFIRCSVCGSYMVVGKQSFGGGATRQRVRCYTCNYRNHRGPTACLN